MKMYRQFKVIIKDEEHLLKVQAQLERLGFTLGTSFYKASRPERATTITTWKEGHYDIWSVVSTAFDFHGHKDALTLETLQKMITAEIGEADATTKPATYFDTPKH